MALFKPFRGSRTTLATTEKHDGYAYFCTDDGSLHFDYLDVNNNLQRKQVNEFAAKSAIVALPAANWIGDSEIYSQVVNLANITPHSKIDFQPTVAQWGDMTAYGIALQAVNEDGVITVYAFGGKPTSDYDMQVCITEMEMT